MGLQFINKLPRIFCSVDVLNEIIEKLQLQPKYSYVPSKRYDSEYLFLQ